MDGSYWRKQTADTPLFPDIEWNKPEQRQRAGSLGIIGGNTLGFAGVADSYQTALRSGAGRVRVVLPDALKKTIPATMTDVVFAATNPSGSLSKDARAELLALADWADVLLLAGDAGRNSETAIVYEELLQHTHAPLVITRDAIDLIKHSPSALAERPDTIIVAAFAQLQKLFQLLYYPKVLTFSMHLSQLVEALHKFTITYPCTIAVLHKDHLVIAHGGDVVTTPWDAPLHIWRGTTAATIASYYLWNPSRPLETATAAVVAP